jgi:phage-related protein
VYAIVFYKDRSGREPVGDYIRALAAKNDKDSRIKANKINDYIEALSVYGMNAGEPYLKHLDGEIWELRPIRERVLFAAHTEDGFVLLHHFMKKTQKTPSREIERAKRELDDFRERLRQQEEGNDNE